MEKERARDTIEAKRLCVCVWVSMCVCRERDRQRHRDRDTERDIYREILQLILF